MVRLFGTTFEETFRALGGAKRPHLGSTIAEAAPEPVDKVKAVGRIVVTLALIAGSTWVLVAGDADSKPIAGGLLGTVVGYWLK